MKRITWNIKLAATICVAFGAHASLAAMTIAVDGIAHMQPIPEAQALCIPTKDGKSEARKEPVRPTITLSGIPKEAASVAIFMMDPDVPTDFSDAGKEGKILPETMERMDFYHYGLVNIPPQVNRIAGSADAGDKNANAPSVIDPANPTHKVTELVNDLGLNAYVMPQHRYGGPCPPWNDARLHHYHFIALALDADAPVTMPEASDSADAAASPHTAKNTFHRLINSKHVIDKATVVGTYTLNPALRAGGK